MTPLRTLHTLALLALATLAGPAAAQDLTWSGFGTLGFARANRDFTYQRSIDRSGTLDRDSLLALQLDARFGPQWSATLQLKLAPSLKHDARWDLTPTWAFLAWRPSDDWLLRAGRLRVPLYLHSESMDVGQAHDMVRLPTELYSVAPSSDFDGVYATRTWALGGGERELSADAYHGNARTTARFWSRDGLPPQVMAGPNFQGVSVRATGLALTLRQPDGVLRASVHRTRTHQTDGNQIPVTFPFVTLAPGLGYYQVSNALPGPGVPMLGTISNTILSLGGEYSFGDGWRVAAEVVHNQQHDTEFASGTHGSYVALFRRVGKLTPYVSVSQLGSRASALDWYQRLTANPLPGFLPGADQLNAAQRLAAEGIWLADQHSLALGASYAVTPNVKLKGEWLHSRIGQLSRQVDTPPGSATPHDTSVDVLSVNLNFAF